MTTFPTYTKFLTGSSQYAPMTIINRTEMDMGPAKQSPKQAYAMPQQQYQIIFSVAQWHAFLAWYKDPTQGNFGASWFTWNDAVVSSSSFQARIVNGDYQANPLTDSTTHVLVKFTFEFNDV
jgi:hypothetical protein